MQQKYTPAGAIAELDVFDYQVGKVEPSKFNMSARKLEDYVAQRYGRNAASQTQTTSGATSILAIR